MGIVTSVARPIAASSEVESVYRQDGDRLWRALYAFAGNEEVASDAVAEAFAQALRRGDEIREPDRWVWRAAFRIARGELKARRGRGQGFPLREELYGMDTGTVELIEALGRLPSKQRASVVLHHGGGYPVREVASIIGSTPAAVRVHLSRGRRRLRDLLGGDDA
jgi:RNA polymerase sigma-70 factor (ECF subfamily)